MTPYVTEIQVLYDNAQPPMWVAVTLEVDAPLQQFTAYIPADVQTAQDLVDWENQVANNFRANAYAYSDYAY